MFNKLRTTQALRPTLCFIKTDMRTSSYWTSAIPARGTWPAARSLKVIYLIAILDISTYLQNEALGLILQQQPDITNCKSM